MLDIIHSDVCGPIEETTLGGCRYCMTLIYPSIRYTFVYFLNKKSEVEDNIREYVKLVQNQFSRKPLIIRADQGEEYLNKAPRKFCADEVIHLYRSLLRHILPKRKESQSGRTIAHRDGSVYRRIGC